MLSLKSLPDWSLSMPLNSLFVGYWLKERSNFKEKFDPDNIILNNINNGKKEEQNIFAS